MYNNKDEIQLHKLFIDNSNNFKLNHEEQFSIHKMSFIKGMIFAFILSVAIVTLGYLWTIQIHKQTDIIVTKGNAKLSMSISKMENVQGLIEELGYYKQDTSNISDRLCEVLIESLEDPYASYYNKDKFEKVQNTFNGKDTNVSYKKIDDTIGFIKITMFSKETPQQFINAIEKLRKEKVKNFIFDVRDNSGGLYNSAIKILDYILPECKIIYTEDKYGNRNYAFSDSNKVDEPYVVLINNNTISAAEIFSSSLQENGCCTIIGQKSYGKGVAQCIKNLNDGSGIRFTVGEYKLPSGKSINGIGTIPNISIKGEDEQIKTAIEFLKKLKK